MSRAAGVAASGLVLILFALLFSAAPLFVATDPRTHGVACAGPHARDVGREGEMPSLETVVAAAGELMRLTAHC